MGSCRASGGLLSTQPVFHLAPRAVGRCSQPFILCQSPGNLKSNETWQRAYERTIETKKEKSQTSKSTQKATPRVSCFRFFFETHVMLFRYDFILFQGSSGAKIADRSRRRQKVNNRTTS